MKNPFPGMNPFLEAHWPDVHTALIASIREQLAGRLPDDLVPRVEERVVITDDGQSWVYRADVAVTEPWAGDLPSAWMPDSEIIGGAAIVEPVVIHLEPETERWVEIQDLQGRLVSVIEVLSPVNKTEEGQIHYQRKRRDYLAGRANVVEIDLLRGGRHTVALPKPLLPAHRGACSWVCVSRIVRPDQREVYPMALRQPLPAIRIPLRPSDRDVRLHLQPLVDRCFETGRYWKLDHRRDPEPPLSADDSRWLDEALRQAGLR